MQVLFDFHLLMGAFEMKDVDVFHHKNRSKRSSKRL